MKKLCLVGVVSILAACSTPAPVRNHTPSFALNVERTKIYCDSAFVELKDPKIAITKEGSLGTKASDPGIPMQIQAANKEYFHRFEEKERRDPSQHARDYVNVVESCRKYGRWKIPGE